jgi:hypothetical protein
MCVKGVTSTREALGLPRNKAVDSRRLTAWLLASMLFGCRGARAVPVARARPVTAAVLALPTTVARGVAYAHDWTGHGARGYGTESDRAQLDRLRALGTTWVCVMPFGYMSNVHDTTIRDSYHRPGSETDAALTRTIREAHARGLRVLLKPHLWVSGSWPGALDPPVEGARMLMDSWSSLTLHYADLAAREHVEAVTVGVEMDSLVRRVPERWRTLIADVRVRYHGMVTYSANWSDVATVPFWDALDVVSVNHYAPLANVPGVVDLASAEAHAVNALARYVSVASRWQKPVWLTEVGFRRDERALIEPWAWVEQTRAPLTPALQSLGYEATFRAVAREPAITAVFVWKWFTSGGDEEEGSQGFVFAGREAEMVVRGAFAQP